MKMLERMAVALGWAFAFVPDEDEAWGDLHRLTQDKDEEVRRSATIASRMAFAYVPDKDKARGDLQRLSR